MKEFISKLYFRLKNSIPKDKTISYGRNSIKPISSFYYEIKKWGFVTIYQYGKYCNGKEVKKSFLRKRNKQWIDLFEQDATYKETGYIHQLLERYKSYWNIPTHIECIMNDFEVQQFIYKR